MLGPLARLEMKIGMTVATRRSRPRLRSIVVTVPTPLASWSYRPSMCKIYLAWLYNDTMTFCRRLQDKEMFKKR